MKKVLALVLALLFVIGACSSVCAQTATLKSTQAFIDELDLMGIKYNMKGLDANGNEVVTVTNKEDDGYTYTVTFFFDESGERLSIRIWNVIEYNELDFTKVLRACNSLNYQYKYLKFYADETDNTVTAAMDQIYCDGDAGDVAIEVLFRSVNIMNDGYEVLAPYDK